MRLGRVDIHRWDPSLPLKFRKTMRFGEFVVHTNDPVTAEHRAEIGKRLRLWWVSRAVAYDLQMVRGHYVRPQAPKAPKAARKSKYADVSAARVAPAAE